MMPDRARIEQLVPHAGAMCLLDAVTQWDAAQITCSSHEPGAVAPAGARRRGARDRRR